MIFDDILKTILSSNKIAIFSHMNCDGDAVGSSIALKLALEKMGKLAYIFIPEPIDEKFEVIHSNSHINLPNTESLNFDLAFGLDCPHKERFGNKLKIFKKINYSINLDHHSDNKLFGTINYVNENASSVSEIIYKMFLHWKFEITKDIATCLYAGISTDTGRFLHANTKPETLCYASELAKLDADIMAVNYNLFERISVAEMDLTKIALNKLELVFNNQIAILCLTKADFKQTGTVSQQAYRLPDLINGIDGVKVAIVMSELNRNEWSVSIRSRQAVAQNIAKRFGGGGHTRAAGCRIYATLKVAKNTIIDVSIKELTDDRNN